MKKYIQDYHVTAVESYAGSYVSLHLTPCEGQLPQLLPGQFVQVLIEQTPSVMLRRPISVNYIDRQRNELWLLVHAIGDGTRWMASRQVGDKLNLLLPLGNGFTLPRRSATESSASARECVLLVGGGVGTAPLLYLARELQLLGCEVHALLGARSKDDVLQADLFGQYATLHITTEDGSLGQPGRVTDHSIWQQQHFDRVYSCGPKPMMVAVAEACQLRSWPCQVSLENTMACGLGACLCCVQDTVKGHLCVCREGPVFDAAVLKW